MWRTFWRRQGTVGVEVMVVVEGPRRGEGREVREEGVGLGVRLEGVVLGMLADARLETSSGSTEG